LWLNLTERLAHKAPITRCSLISRRMRRDRKPITLVAAWTRKESQSKGRKYAFPLRLERQPRNRETSVINLLREPASLGSWKVELRYSLGFGGWDLELRMTMQLPFEQFPALNAIGICRHVFTQRIPGIDVSHDKAEVLRRLDAAHREIRNAIGVGDWPLLTAQQIHGTKIAVADAPLK